MTRRWDWTYRHGRSLLVTSVVTVVLLTAAFVIVVTIGERDGAPDTDCVVGSWRTVESEQHLSADLGTLILADDGPVTTYRDDGTGTTDYRDGVTYRIADSPLGLADIDLVISGTAEYDYVLDGGTIQYDNISSHLSQSTDVLGSVPTSLSDEAYGYRCEGDTLTFHIETRYEARLVRLD